MKKRDYWFWALFAVFTVIALLTICSCGDLLQAGGHILQAGSDTLQAAGEHLTETGQ